MVPKLAWTKYESGRQVELMTPSCHGMDAVDDLQWQLCRGLAGRMCKVVFWCMQRQSKAKPPMGAVVKMLEGEMYIALPANPLFRHLMVDVPAENLWMTMTSSVNTTSALENDTRSISQGGNEITSL
ncbi:hypothetical protein VPH35_109568 [Triticum aestivum]|uniref:Uncharacterized protein n=1 Tax=Triticum turgidum subsp. durum TaxID=4567 RepID=A0A9R1B7X7_TRITD|nr:unnamed protein product [Triticum turgidum subsp. durum]